MPTKSGNGSSYDPWKDLNDDGVIDSTDLGMLGTSWATTGDPTKNVNVTNWPTQQPEPSWKVIYVSNEPNGELNLTFTSGWCSYRTFVYFVGGYSRMCIHMKITNVSYVGLGKTTVSFDRLIWETETDPNRYIIGVDEIPNLNITIEYSGNVPVYRLQGIPTFEVKAPYLSMGISVQSEISTGWVSLQVDIYLRNE
jgi:hypothetical protein